MWRHRDGEQLKEVVQTYWGQIGQEVIDRAIGQFANDCHSLLQPVEDTLSTALTNVLGATRTSALSARVPECQKLKM